MSTPSEPVPPAPSGALAVILMVLGIIFVLPGICSLVWAGLMLAESGTKAFADPHVVLVYVVWAFCALITLGGIAMILAARRRFAARAARDT